MRVLLLSGGGFRGAFQLPIIRHLLHSHTYDEIRGVSVGSINGVLAAQRKLDIMDELWKGIDDPRPIDGVTGFLAPAIHRWKGLYSLEPIAKLLRRHVFTRDLATNFGAGVTIRETGRYRTLRFRPGSAADAQLHTAILGSSAIGGLMEPIPAQIGTDAVLLSDGGHRHVLPPPPQEATEIDAVFCSPIEEAPRPTSAINGLLEAMAWAIDMQMHATQDGDIEILRTAVEQGKTVRVWAPLSDHGGLLSASKETIAARIDEGRRAISRGPVAP